MEEIGDEMKAQSVVTALYDYEAQSDEDLSFYEHQVLFIIDSENENWYKALLIFPSEEGGWERQEGLIPSTYVSTEPSDPILNVIANYEYQASTDEEIDLIEGEPLWIYDDRDNDWWLAAKSLDDGIDVGLVPASYVTKDDNEEYQVANGQSSEAIPQYAPESMRTYTASIQDKKNKRRNHKALVGTDKADFYILNMDDTSIIHQFPVQVVRVSSKYGRNVEIKTDSHHFVIELNEEEDSEILLTELDAVGGADDKEKKGGLKGIFKKGTLGKSNSPASRPTSVGVPSSAVKQSIGAPTALAPPPLLEKSPAAAGKTKSTSNSSFTASLASGNPPKLAIAMFDFDPENDEEVEIREGDNLVILDDESSPDWTNVRVVSSRGKKEGLVPRNYIEFKQPGISGASSRDDVRSDTYSDYGREPSPEPQTVTPPPPLARRPVLSDRPSDLSKAPALPPQTKGRPNVSEEHLRRILASQGRQQPAQDYEGSDAGSDGSAPPKLPPGRERAERELLGRSGLPDEEDSGGGAPPPLAPRPNITADSPNMSSLSVETSPQREPANKPPLMPRPNISSSLHSQPSNAASRMLSQTSSRSDPSKAPAPNSTALRPWQDRTGTFKVEAEFLGYQDNKVHLHKANGVKIAVPIEKLSQPDIDHVFQVLGEPKPKHLQASPTRTSSLNSSDIRATSPPLVQSPTKAGSTSQSANVAQNAPHKECVYNDFDWYKFLTDAAIPHSDAIKYGTKFAKERMDSTILSDLTRDMLKDLQIPEGDIIRILRSGNAFRPGGSGLVTKIHESEEKLRKQNMATIDGLVAGKLQEQEAKKNREAKQDQERRDAEIAKSIQNIERTNLVAMKNSSAAPAIASAASSIMSRASPASASFSSVKKSANDFEADFSQLSKPVPPSQPANSGLPPPLIPTPAKQTQSQQQFGQFPGFPSSQMNQLAQATNQMALVPTSTAMASNSLSYGQNSSSGQFGNNFNPSGFSQAAGFAANAIQSAPMQNSGFGMHPRQGPSGVFANGGHPGMQQPMPSNNSFSGSSVTGGFQPAWAPPAPNNSSFGNSGITPGNMAATAMQYGADKYAAFKTVDPTAPSLFSQSHPSMGTNSQPGWQPPTPASLLGQQNQPSQYQRF